MRCYWAGREKGKHFDHTGDASFHYREGVEILGVKTPCAAQGKEKPRSHTVTWRYPISV